MTLSIKSASQLDVNEPEQKLTSKATAFVKLLAQLPKVSEPPKTPLGSIRLKFRYTVSTPLPCLSFFFFFFFFLYLFSLRFDKLAHFRKMLCWEQLTMTS